MKKIIGFLSLFLLVFVLGGCTSKTTPTPIYRDINENDIKEFTPINYTAAKDSISGNVMISKIANSYLLPVNANGDMMTDGKAKIEILTFNEKSNNYQKIGEYDGPGDVIESMQNTNSFDVNGDGVNEYFVVFRTSGVSSNGYKLVVLSFVNNELKELGSADILNNQYFTINTTDRSLITGNYIWNLEAGETHFSCHYFKIDTYGFDNGSLIQKNSRTTKYQYNFGDGLTDNIKCLDFKENFYDFLRSENVSL